MGLGVMGFDLSGKNPTLHTNMPEDPQDWDAQQAWHKENPGVYFRNNVWWWRPLWAYVSNVCSDILKDIDIEYGSSNNGHFVSKAKSIKIGKRLDKLHKSGDIAAYEEEHKRLLSEMSDDDFQKSYPFSEDNVQSFAVFAKECGGFYIC